MGFCSVAQAPLTFSVFLLSPPNCWDSWCETPKLANSLNDFWDPGPVRANSFRRGAFGEVTCSWSICLNHYWSTSWLSRPVGWKLKTKPVTSDGVTHQWGHRCPNRKCRTQTSGTLDAGLLKSTPVTLMSAQKALSPKQTYSKVLKVRCRGELKEGM